MANTVKAVFTLTRDKFAEDSSLDYATSDGTALAGADYVAKSGRVLIPAGTESVQISIDVMKKPRGTPDKTFFLTLKRASKGTVLSRLQAMCTIYTTSQGLPVITISDATLSTLTTPEVSIGDAVITIL